MYISMTCTLGGDYQYPFKMEIEHWTPKTL